MLLSSTMAHFAFSSPSSIRSRLNFPTYRHKNQVTCSILFSMPVSPIPLGIRSELLSPCPSTSTCVTSQHDTPPMFVEPWEYEEPLSKLKPRLIKLVRSLFPEAKMLESTANYLRFELNGPDDMEFYFPDGDKIVHFRSGRRDSSYDFGSNRRHLETIRKKLGLAPVPVLRNRVRRFWLFETPFDNFGPSAVDVDAIIDNRGISSRPVK